MAAMAATFSAFPLGGLLANVDGGVALLVLQRVVCGLLVIVGAWLAVRCARIGVFYDDDSLLVRNVLREHSVMWTDVASFDAPAEYGTVRNAGLLVHLKNGEVISATAIARGRFESSKSSDEATEFLTVLLERHQA